jgi:hypothetical protein
MDDENSVSIPHIGSELVKESEGPALARLPIQTQLFPYLQAASQGMSLREISAWLKKSHGVVLSPATISRALNSPGVHLENLANAIVPLARRVALNLQMKPFHLLFGYSDPSEKVSNLEYLSQIAQAPSSEEEAYEQGAFAELEELWENLPHDGKQMLRPFLQELLEDGEDEIMY